MATRVENDLCASDMYVRSDDTQSLRVHTSYITNWVAWCAAAAAVVDDKRLQSNDPQCGGAPCALIFWFLLFMRLVLHFKNNSAIHSSAR